MILANLIAFTALTGISNVIASNDYCPNYSQQDLDRIRTSEQVSDGDRDFYRAAVVEHNRVDKADIHDSIRENLAFFNLATKRAAAEGAEIIVFPEDGLLFGARTRLEPVLEPIPDPDTLSSEQNNPCQSPDLFDSYILKNLSCIARDNNIYLVANFGTRYNCAPNSQIDEFRVCPENGFLALNTDVILDNHGNFLKRYHKFNMYLEVFDKSPELEIVYIDTPFGRLGIFTCFDILFKYPALSLIEEKKVDTILFPTWWFDELPILTAVHFQDAWSAANQVNILAANTNRLRSGSVGSGIFSGNNSIHTRPTDSNSKLLLATLPRRGDTKNCKVNFDSKLIVLETETPADVYEYKTYALQQSDTIYVLNLDGTYHEVRYCSGSVCCELGYRTSEDYRRNLRDRLILIVRDNVRPGKLNWYEQVCFVATLAKPYTGSLENVTYALHGVARFETMKLIGSFSTKYIYPIAASNPNDMLKREKRLFDCDDRESKVSTCRLMLNAPEGMTINAFGLYGRKHQADQMPDGF